MMDMDPPLQQLLRALKMGGQETRDATVSSFFFFFEQQKQSLLVKNDFKTKNGLKLFCLYFRVYTRSEKVSKSGKVRKMRVLELKSRNLKKSRYCQFKFTKFLVFKSLQMIENKLIL